MFWNLRDTKSLFSALTFPLAVLGAHYLLRNAGVYSTYPNIDILIHFLGGFVITNSFSAIISYKNSYTKNQSENLIYLLFLLFATISIAVFWEFAEFLTDFLAGTNVQISIANTIKDLFFGFMGSMSYLLMNVRRLAFSRS